MRIRDFVEDDQEAVRALILDGLIERWGTLDEALNPELNAIGRSFAHGRTVVVENSGGVIATGTILPRDALTAEILRMSVRPDWRRQGVGRLIVDELVKTARQWRVGRVILETTSDWHDAIALYLACGFTITHTEASPFGEDTWFELPIGRSKRPWS